MKKLLILFLLGSIANAESTLGTWQLNSGQLTYHVHFVLKKVEGVSKQVKGKGLCTKELCKFLVAAPIKSFDSEDTNRDFHMLEVTKGATYPLVSVSVETKNVSKSQKQMANISVTFAGKTKDFKDFPIHVQLSEDQLQATGQLPIQLTDFSVERPSLLGMKIEDKVEIDFSLNFKKEDH